MDPICFIDYSKSKFVHKGLDFLCEGLNKDGVDARWFVSPSEAPEGAILILHDPVEVGEIPKDCKVLGQRTLNRRERLVLAEQCGLPVVAWSAVDQLDEIPELFDRWQVDEILFKADWSYARCGVQMLTRRHWQPFSPRRFNPDADIFMRILNGRPDTYKVDHFYDHAFACRHMHTASVYRNFYGPFSKSNSVAELPPLHAGYIQLGHAVMRHGVGFSGTDIMYDRNEEPWIIELNTCSLGREQTWMCWPGLYLHGYLQGLRNWIADGSPAEFCNDVSPFARELTARTGGGYPGYAA